MKKSYNARMEPVETINPFSASFVYVELIYKVATILKKN